MINSDVEGQKTTHMISKRCSMSLKTIQGILKTSSRIK